MKIALDPGHSGDGTGANGSIDEARQNWKLANYLAPELKAYGIDTMLTRSQNEKPELDVRAQRAKAAGCIGYLSLHFNAGGGDGVEVYPQFYGDKYLVANSKKLATDVLAAVVSAGQQTRGIKYLPNSDNTREFYGMLYEPRIRGITSILLELGFVDSSDALDFDTDAELKNWAKVIAAGVATAYGVSVPKVNYTITVKGNGTKAEAEAALAKVKTTGLTGTLTY